MKVITIADQKGGVGKSTISNAVIAGLTRKGFNVLGVDLDSQANLTSATGADNTGQTMLGVLTGEVKAQDAIQHTPVGDIIPSSPMLVTADSLLVATGKEYKLKEALEPISGLYDYCIVDTPPALSILTVNALTCCDYVIIPAVADLFSLQGITQLTDTINQVRTYTNPKIKVAGIVLNMYNPRTNLQREVADYITQVSSSLGTTLFKSTIRNSIKVKEAPFSQKSIYEYAPKEKVTADFTAFIDELMKRVD